MTFKAIFIILVAFCFCGFVSLYFLALYLCYSIVLWNALYFYFALKYSKFDFGIGALKL